MFVVINIELLISALYASKCIIGNILDLRDAKYGGMHLRLD